MTADRDKNLSHACQQVGRFLYNFALLEEEMNLVIGQVLDTEEDLTDILAANLDFFRKIKIIRSAVASQPNWANKKKDKANKIAAKIISHNNDRRIVAHSAFSAGTKGKVVFRRAVADEKLKRENPTWDGAMFRAKFAGLQTTTTELAVLRKSLMPVINLVARDLVTGPPELGSPKLVVLNDRIELWDDS